MSAPELSPGSLAALGDKEIEILRLLTEGHTVKSIAVRLGRSEASINERLRDARRKTGVGSSRELARLLDAQKIWDKKIDLAAPGATTDDPAAPPEAVRKRSKGKIIMLLAMPLAAAGLVVAAPDSAQQAPVPQPAQATASKQSPLAGSWALDVMRIPADERPRRVTISFRVTPDRKWTTVVDMVGPDGVSRHAESTAAPDGMPVPVSGTMDFIDTVSLRQPAANTLVMTLGKNGTPVSTRVYTAGKDRRSMTETIVWAGTAMPKLETTHFNRVD